MSSKHRVFTIVISAVVAALFVTAGIVYSVMAIRENERQKEIAALAAPYEAELSIVQSKVQMIERKYEAKLPVGAFLDFAFINLQPEIVTSLFPIFDKYTPKDATEPVISGTLCLSPTDLPGLEGKMSREDYDMLISEGWSSAIFVRPEDIEKLDEYLLLMKTTLADMDIPVPATLYFDKNSYSYSLDEVILDAGFTTVIHYGKEDPDLRLIGRDTSSELWRVGSVGWSGVAGSSNIYESSSAALAELRGGKGALVFSMEITYGNPLSRNDPRQFFPGNNNDAVGRMISTIVEFIGKGELVISDANAARAKYENYLYEYECMRPVIAAERSELLREIERLEGIIKSIHKGESFGN